MTPTMAPMKAMLTTSCLLLCSCGAEKFNETGSPEAARTGDLSVLTYNVHGLPPEITGDDTAGRMEQIAPRLSSWDLIGLQENFDDDNNARLIDGAGHASTLWFDEQLPDRFYGSGLSVLSQLGIIDAQNTHYSACHGYADSSSDCLASKGFQAVRVAVGGASIDLYNTHLEAGGGDEDNAARQTQVEELIASLNGWSAGHAVIFTGDFNLRETDPDDLPLIEQLLGEAQLTRSCAAVTCDEPSHIDKILFRSSESVTLSVLSWSNLAPDFEDNQGVALSDHPPISANFSFATH